MRLDSVVRNYKIHDNYGSYFLVQRASFPSVQELVYYYLEEQDGLCAKLDKPCIKVRWLIVRLSVDDLSDREEHGTLRCKGPTKPKG